jgi:hypothetical protein
MNSLRMSFWVVPSSWARHARRLRGHDVLAPDGAAGVMVIEVETLERQAGEQHLHVGEAADRDAARAELALASGSSVS